MKIRDSVKFYFAAMPKWAQKAVRLALPALFIGFVFSILLFVSATLITRTLEAKPDKHDRIAYYSQQLESEKITLTEIKQFRQIRMNDTFWGAVVSFSIAALLLGNLYAWAQRRSDALLKTES